MENLINYTDTSGDNLNTSEQIHIDNINKSHFGIHMTLDSELSS